MGVIEKAIEFESRKHVYKSTNEKIVASREVKNLILDLNEIYKEIKLKINKGNTSSEFVRNYILGIFNLIIGLALLNFFQYYLYLSGPFC